MNCILPQTTWITLPRPPLMRGRACQARVADSMAVLADRPGVYRPWLPALLHL